MSLLPPCSNGFRCYSKHFKVTVGVLKYFQANGNGKGMFMFVALTDFIQVLPQGVMSSLHVTCLVQYVC